MTAIRPGPAAAGEADATGGRPVRVLIADDQKVVRDGLSLMLGLVGGIEVVGTAVDGDDAVRQVTRTAVDVVLMDLHMPGCDGVAATARIVSQRPATRIVVLTTYTDDEWVFRALQAGARGFVTKDADAEQIRDAVVTVAGGQAQLDPAVQRRLLEVLAAGAAGPSAPALVGGERAAEGRTRGAAGDEPSPAVAALTARECEVLVRIARGEANAEIAAALYVSAATVKTHINHLLAKTGCRDRAQLVVLAYREGLVR